MLNKRLNYNKTVDSIKCEIGVGINKKIERLFVSANLSVVGLLNEPFVSSLLGVNFSAIKTMLVKRQFGLVDEFSKNDNLGSNIVLLKLLEKFLDRLDNNKLVLDQLNEIGSRLANDIDDYKKMFLVDNTESKKLNAETVREICTEIISSELKTIRGYDNINERVVGNEIKRSRGRPSKRSQQKNI